MTSKPQDHKKKKPKTDPGSVRITVRGVDLTIPVSALDDYELMEDLVSAQSLSGSTDPQDMGRAAQAGFRVLGRMLGDRDMARIKDAVRNPDTGRVPMSEMMAVLGEIFEAANPNS